MYRITVFLSASILLLCASCTAPSLPESLSTASAFQDELVYVVDLARHRYWDLAEDRLRNLETYRLDADQEISLNLTRFTVKRLQALHGRDEQYKCDTCREALRQFREIEPLLTSRTGHIEIRVDAAEVYQELGKTLVGRTAGAKDPGQKAVFKEDAGAACRDGVHLLDEVIGMLAPIIKKLVGETIMWPQPYEEQNLQQRARYLKGTIHYYWARTCDDEETREERLLKCIETLDDYIWESDEQDFYALWAYLYQAMAYRMLDNLPEALELGGAVIHSEFGIDLDQAMVLPPEYARLVTELAEAAYRSIAEFHRQTGDHDKAEATLEEMKKQFRSRNLTLSGEGEWDE
jgi:tetratricopeptide (TPR) repeat protein